MRDFSEFRSRVEALIRGGQRHIARRELGKLAKKKPARTEAVILAELARRAGLSELGVRILNPLVRPGRRSPAQPRPAEMAEYGACLTQLGATDEAIQILRSLDAEELPQVNFFHALALISRWDYGGAAIKLEHYLRSPKLSEYQVLVGKTNLADARLAVGETENIPALLNELLAATTTRESQLLRRAVLDLGARYAILRKDWPVAEEYLEKIERLFEGTRDLHLLFLKKWRCFIRISREGATRQSMKQLIELRNEARHWVHWETRRECDRYEAIAKHDLKLAIHIYYGTPYEGYRQKLKWDFGEDFILPESYTWRPEGSTRSTPTLDLLTGEWTGGPRRLKLDQLLHRSFLALSRDYYLPIRLATLHARLYPRENFNPSSSANRVHRVLNRLRTWCREAGLPFRIVELRGGYRLEGTGTGALRIGIFQVREHTPPSALSRLRLEWSEKSFTTKEVAATMGFSPRSALRLLESGEREGILERSGSRRATRFRFR